MTGWYILIVREKTAWTEARAEMLQKFSKIHFKKTYLTEEQLKEDVKASGAHNELFVVEDDIATFIHLQKLRYRPPNDRPIVIRVCEPDGMNEELRRFQPNWVITVGTNYTYIKACQTMLSQTRVVGINAGPFGHHGSLCYGGRFSPAIHLKEMSPSILYRYRIFLQVVAPATKNQDAQTLEWFALNEIFIGNKDAEKQTKAKMHLCAHREVKGTRFKEMLMLTGTGYNFRTAVAKTTQSIGAYVDIHRHLDTKTSNRVTDFKIMKARMHESDDEFLVFNRHFTYDGRKDHVCGNKTKSMALEIESSGVFFVLDGMQKFDIPKGVVMKFIMKGEDALLTYKKNGTLV